MNIDISKIVQDKINELEKESTIEKVIAESLEKTITKAVSDSLESYSLRKMIEEKVSQEVNKVAADLDFRSYNSFIAEKMKQLINDVCRKDLSEKIEEKFKKIFLNSTGEIKLSSILEKYREFACEQVEEDEKYSRDDGWHCKCDLDDSLFIRCELDYKERDYYSRAECDIAFSIFRDIKDRTKGTISSLYIGGEDINKKFNFSYLDDIKLMLVQAAMNETPIIIDIENEDDIDNSFDVDY